MRTTREKEAREITAGGQEIAGGIMTRAEREAATIRTTAESDAMTIVGTAIAEAGRIKAKSRELNPQLFDIVARHEVALQAMRGSNLIFPADHWLLRVFDDPALSLRAPGEDPESASEKGDDQ